MHTQSTAAPSTGSSQGQASSPAVVICLLLCECSNGMTHLMGPGTDFEQCSSMNRHKLVCIRKHCAVCSGVPCKLVITSSHAALVLRCSFDLETTKTTLQAEKRAVIEVALDVSASMTARFSACRKAIGFLEIKGALQDKSITKSAAGRGLVLAQQHAHIPMFEQASPTAKMTVMASQHAWWSDLRQGQSKHVSMHHISLTDDVRLHLGNINPPRHGPLLPTGQNGGLEAHGAHGGSGS